MDRRIFIFAAITAVMGSLVVYAREPVETNMMTRVFTGSKISNEVAFEKADAVFEAVVVDQGIASPAGGGYTDYNGIKVQVIRNCKGTHENAVSVDLSIKSWPGNEAEISPKKGEKMLFFLERDTFSSNRVRKILPSTEDNFAAIQRIRNEVLYRDLKHPSLQIKIMAAKELADMNTAESVPELLNALKENQAQLTGGTETELLQRELNQSLLISLERQTGLKLSDELIDVQTAIDRVDKWLRDKPANRK